MPQLALIVPVHMGGGGMYPDNTLPGGQGGHPWFPGHGGGEHPSHGLPGGGHPSGGPIPLPPNQPWPPGVNPPLVPPNAPPGSIWPPLPPEAGMPAGKALLIVALTGHGMRYVVVDTANIPQPK